MVIFRELRQQAKNAFEIEECGLDGNATVDVGFAVDIGTTTVAVTAFDLHGKKKTGELSEINSQTALGADVMMRVMHAISGRGGALHRMIVQQVGEMAGQAAGGIKSGKRYSFFVVGNTAMCHFFLGKSTEGLAGYPFCPAYQGGYRCSGKEIGMELFPDASVYVLSGIAAHVGGDALAVIGAEKLYQQDKVQLAVDLGTNAEMILNRKGKISVCSAAAGPAFEGKGISCGMPAKAGAVAGVKISAGNGNLILEVVEGLPVQGICCSGIIDLLAQLRKCRILREDGYLPDAHGAVGQSVPPFLYRRLVSRKGQNAFVLCTEEEAGKEIVLLQSDIRSLQLAKGAVQAGILSLLSAVGLAEDEVDEFVVAGVLGSSMRAASAIKIGLFPAAFSDRIRFVGNAAGKGAALGLLDTAFSEKMEMLAKTVSHVELAQQENFKKYLIQAMDLCQWL